MIEKTNIADLCTPDGEPLVPQWFDLDNYDVEPDWTQPGETMRVYRPADDAESPLDFD